MRDAIYSELLRGRRVRYHHKIAVATERAHADAPDSYVNELAHHFYMGAALADADKASFYCRAAGERALRLLAFEEAAVHFARSLEVAEQFGPDDPPARCDALIALAEAQNRAGDTAPANTNIEKAAVLARSMGDAGRLAAAALRAGPLSYLGIVRANRDQVQLLEEARAALPETEDSHLRAMVTARLGLVVVYADDVPAPGALARSLALSNEAVAMARRLDDRVALGYALNARMHALWGIEPAPERLATGKELGEIADDIGDELLALHGHMWRIRELLAQGDVDAVNEEIARFRARDTGPVHPLEASFGFNVTAMMALLGGEFETAEQLGQRALEVADGHNELALSFYGALMMWTWWQRGDMAPPDAAFRALVAQAPPEYPTVSAVLALVHAEAGETEAALAQLHALEALGWEQVADDQSEGVSLAMAAAACSVIGPPARDLARGFTRRCAPTQVPSSSSARRLRPASVRPTTISGSWPGPWATSPWPRCTTRPRCAWPAAWAPRPSWPRPKWSWPAPCASGAGRATRSGWRCCCAARRSPRGAWDCSGWPSWPRHRAEGSSAGRGALLGGPHGWILARPRRPPACRRRRGCAGSCR